MRTNILCLKGNSEAVAYNRNTYLDILEVIRQDRELESKYKELKEQTQSLNTVLMFVLLFVPIFLVAFFVYFRLWSLRARQQTEALRHTLEFCDTLSDPSVVCQKTITGNGWSKIENRIVQQVFQALSLWAKNTVEKLKSLDEEYQMICDERYLSDFDMNQKDVCRHSWNNHFRYIDQVQVYRHHQTDRVGKSFF